MQEKKLTSETRRSVQPCSPFKSILSSSVIKKFESREKEITLGESARRRRRRRRLDFSHVRSSMDFEWPRQYLLLLLLLHLWSSMRVPSNLAEQQYLMDEWMPLPRSTLKLGINFNRKPLTDIFPHSQLSCSQLFLLTTWYFYIP